MRSANATITLINSLLETSQNRVIELEKERESSLQRSRELEMELGEQKTELLKVSLELEEQLSAQLEVGDAKQAHEEAAEQCESLRAEISVLVAKHQAERESDRHSIEALIAELAVSNQKVEELESNVRGTAEEMKFNSEQYFKQAQDAEQYVIKNSELQLELAELKSTVERLSANEKTLEQLTTEHSDMHIRLVESEKLSNELRIALDNSNKENEVLNERYAGSSSVFGDEMAALQSQLVEQQRIAEELRNRLLESDSLRSQLSVELERELISASIKLDEIKLLEDERDALRATVDELHAKVSITYRMFNLEI